MLVPPIKLNRSHGLGTSGRPSALEISSIMRSKMSRLDKPRIPPPSAIVSRRAKLMGCNLPSERIRSGVDGWSGGAMILWYVCIWYGRFLNVSCSATRRGIPFVSHLSRQLYSAAADNNRSVTGHVIEFSRMHIGRGQWCTFDTRQSQPSNRIAALVHLRSGVLP